MSASWAGLPEIESYGMDWADVYFGLRGGGTLDDMSDIPAAVLSAQPGGAGSDLGAALAEDALVPGARAG